MQRGAARPALGLRPTFTAIQWWWAAMIPTGDRSRVAQQVASVQHFVMQATRPNPALERTRRLVASSSKQRWRRAAQLRRWASRVGNISGSRRSRVGYSDRASEKSSPIFYILGASAR